MNCSIVIRIEYYSFRKLSAILVTWILVVQELLIKLSALRILNARSGYLKKAGNSISTLEKKGKLLIN